MSRRRGRLIMDLGNYGGRLESYKIDAKGKLQIEKSDAAGGNKLSINPPGSASSYLSQSMTPLLHLH